MLPAGSYDGTTVLITGGGTGLGRAMAVEFARLGARVGIVSRDPAHHAAGVTAVEQAVDEAAPAGRPKRAVAVGAVADVRDPEQVAAAFDAVESALGPVSVLVNNAAANFPVLAAELSPGGWRAVVDVVLTGSFLCSRELHRRHVARGARPGAILNISAAQAFTGGPGMVHSASAKAGVDAMTKTLAVEWAPDGIRVNGLVPGLFPHQDLPASLRALRERDPDQDATDARRQPAGRVGQPHELGWAATYLCSPFAGFLTGHTLVLDGGNHLRRDFVMPPVVPVAEQLRPRSL
ncbi:NAD(P)-dependent dehydrogenase, short-chain alcohol dehydrogenase family [Streptacidiphilus jiangxiensis]|uniref:Peroxisomal trans-2-enoyl-CoA reductase n=2 Tax=Streptacidiphilus jiangxiensis TaxID=235985 RepID=A0A1H7UMK3_STRJI|nr:NAD(P)-dependent dehydrogenase, short-chain alcohol dehydrogenase family [Streptacidiphilus jiangxiensis]